MNLCEEELGNNFSYIDRLEIFYFRKKLIIKLHDAREVMSPKISFKVGCLGVFFILKVFLKSLFAIEFLWNRRKSRANYNQGPNKITFRLLQATPFFYCLFDCLLGWYFHALQECLWIHPTKLSKTLKFANLSRRKIQEKSEFLNLSRHLNSFS